MISGGAAGKGEREDEAESDKPNGTQPAPDNREHAPDKKEGALSSALSQEQARDKRKGAPVHLKERRSPSEDKSVSSQQEGTNQIERIPLAWAIH